VPIDNADAPIQLLAPGDSRVMSSA
jgi:hypothetical protein